MAAVLYVVGAIGFEVAGAPMASDDRIESVPYLLVMTLEEGCEMVGACIFLYAVLNHLQASRRGEPLELQLGP